MQPKYFGTLTSFFEDLNAELEMFCDFAIKFPIFCEFLGKRQIQKVFLRLLVTFNERIALHSIEQRSKMLNFETIRINKVCTSMVCLYILSYVKFVLKSTLTTTLYQP